MEVISWKGKLFPSIGCWHSSMVVQIIIDFILCRVNRHSTFREIEKFSEKLFAEKVWPLTGHFNIALLTVQFVGMKIQVSNLYLQRGDTEFPSSLCGHYTIANNMQNIIISYWSYFEQLLFVPCSHFVRRSLFSSLCQFSPDKCVRYVLSISACLFNQCSCFELVVKIDVDPRHEPMFFIWIIYHYCRLVSSYSMATLQYVVQVQYYWKLLNTNIFYSGRREDLILLY